MHVIAWLMIAYQYQNIASSWDEKVSGEETCEMYAGESSRQRTCVSVENHVFMTVPDVIAF